MRLARPDGGMLGSGGRRIEADALEAPQDTRKHVEHGSARWRRQEARRTCCRPALAWRRCWLSGRRHV